jgi:hypothetical protein
MLLPSAIVLVTVLAVAHAQSPATTLTPMD